MSTDKKNPFILTKEELDRKASLAALMQHWGLTREKVASVIGKSPRTITRYLSEEESSTPSIAEIKLLESSLKVDIMTTGEGGDTQSSSEGAEPNPRTAEPPISYANGPAATSTSLLPSVTAVVPSAARQAERLDSIVRDVVTFEIFTDIRARAGNAVEVYVEGTTFSIQLPRFLVTQLLGFMPPARLGVVICDGDSMSPIYEDGDILLYEPIYEVNGGGNYVVVIDGAVLAKRIQRLSGGGFKIISANRDAGYDDEILLPVADEHDPHLINKATSLRASFHPVGKIRWPRPDADRIHVERVTDILRNLIKSGQLST